MSNAFKHPIFHYFPLSKLALSFGAMLVLAVLSGCASTPSMQKAGSDKTVAEDVDPFDARDPIKSVNKATFGFNLYADRYVIKPVAGEYHHLPSPVRTSVDSFLNNLDEPLNFINGVLQADPKGAAISLSRFVMNTAIGVGGLFDVATPNGLPDQDQSFSKTLRRYGVSEGPYVVLPLLGPSTVRDTTGQVVDFFIDPVSYFLTTPENIAQAAANGIDTRDENDAIIDELYYKSIEPYSTTRAAYLQHQAFQ